MHLSSLVETLYNQADTFHSYRLYNYYKDKGIDCLIDVGSHKGEFIVKVLKDTRIPIYSFEPQLNVIDELKNNTKVFNVLDYFPFALSDSSGSINFYFNELTSTSSSKKADEKNLWIKFKKLILGNVLLTHSEKVKVCKLDDVFTDELKEYKCILLKIDVEGAEADVLRGASKIINNNAIKYIQIEDSNFNIYGGLRNSSPFSQLKEYRYFEDKRFIFPFLNFTDVVFKNELS